MIFCPLYSGSSGNSVFVASDSARILIDAGLSGKNIEKALNAVDEKAETIEAIFVTHEHTDHTKGVGVLSRKYDIPIYANKLTWEAMQKTIGKIKEKNINIIDKYTSIKDLNIESFRISHDAADPMGYSIKNKNKKACIATDLGFLSNEVKSALEDSDVVLLESNHDTEMLMFGPYPYNLKRRVLSKVGHLSNEDCGKAIIEILNSKKLNVILGHLSKVNNYPELAYQTVLNELTNGKIQVGKDINLGIADRNKPSCYIRV